MSEGKLKKCPFCGVIPRIVTMGDYGYDIMCRTADCYLECGADWCVTKGEAVAMWNYRKEEAK